MPAGADSLAAVRVLLRTPQPEDRDEFIAAMLASRRFHRPWMTGVITDEAYDRLLGRVGDDRFDPNFVCRVDDGAIVGFFNLGEITRGYLQSACVGYGAVAAHAGRGYMAEGMQLLLGRAFNELRLHRVEANIQPGSGHRRWLSARVSGARASPSATWYGWALA